MLSSTADQGSNCTHRVRILKKSERDLTAKPDPKGIQDKTKPSQALTLAELTAGLPWAMFIPIKLLRLVLNRDIECVTNVRIVQIAH